MRLKAGALSFNVVDVGAGNPALLFLHYWGGSAWTWGGVTSYLSEDNRCIAYDQRGWGSSDAPTDGYSIADLARDAKEIARAMGGKAAQLLASQRPEMRASVEDGGKSLSQHSQFGRSVNAITRSKVGPDPVTLKIGF
jgi:pimeloyl-ACP methyl ester carboxylesterase